MAHNSDHIPDVAAEIWKGAPETIYTDMLANHLGAKEAYERYAREVSTEYDIYSDEESYDVIDDEEALEKAAYQTAISNQQKLRLMQEGFTRDEAEMRNPGTSGILTPWGIGLEDADVDIIMDEYPGLYAYAGTNMNEWDSLEEYAVMIESQGGKDIDTVVSNVEEIATNQGALDNVWDFFGSVGDSLGDAITTSGKAEMQQGVRGAGFEEELSMMLFGETDPTIEALEPIVEEIGDVVDWVKQGWDTIVDATELSLEAQADAMIVAGASTDIYGTAVGETFQNIVGAAGDLIPSFDPDQPGGMLGGIQRGGGPFLGTLGALIPGKHFPSEEDEFEWDYPETQKKSDILDLRFEYKDLFGDLNDRGVAGMAEWLGNPDNYDLDAPMLIAEDVENWLSALSAMGIEDQETIDILRAGFANRMIRPEAVAAAQAAETTLDIVTTADRVVEEQKADQATRTAQAQGLYEGGGWDTVFEQDYGAPPGSTTTADQATQVTGDELGDEVGDEVGDDEDVDMELWLEGIGQQARNYFNSFVERGMSPADAKTRTEVALDAGIIGAPEEQIVDPRGEPEAFEERRRQQQKTGQSGYFRDYETWKAVTGEEGTQAELEEKFEASLYYNPDSYGLGDGEDGERDPLEAWAAELAGIDWNTQFWGEFNQLRGSGSAEAQRYIGPALLNEIETLWYLLEGYPDDDPAAVSDAVNMFFLENIEPGEKVKLGDLDPNTYKGQRARDVEQGFGEYVYDFFSDPNEMRYGDAFYEGVEDLRDSMSFYEDMPYVDKLNYWQDWDAEGSQQGLYGSSTPVDDVYAYYHFMDPTSDKAAKRLTSLVAMYNTAEGSDAWFRSNQRTIYENLYKDWIRADMSPESFLKTFVKGGKTSEEV
jgi:hypothetical protein